MTQEELIKQLATSQAQVQQLSSQLAKMGGGAAQPTQNPYSVATDAARGAKSAADAADAMMPRGPVPGSSPVPMPGADSVLDPSTETTVTLSPEEQDYRKNRGMLADLYVRQALMEANRPYRKPKVSSRMPEDPYDKVMARELSSPAMDGYSRMSRADQTKIDRRAGMAGMDVAGFLGLSPLDQYKAINGMSGERRNLPAGPADAGTRITLPARPGDGGTLIPLNAGAAANASVIGSPVEGSVYTRDGASPTSRILAGPQFNAPAQARNFATNSIPNAQFTSFNSGVQTVISPNAPAFGAPFSGPGSFIRGAISAPINATRKSSEIARDLTYRSNLAGSALESLRRPAMRFGL